MRKDKHVEDSMEELCECGHARGFHNILSEVEEEQFKKEQPGPIYKNDGKCKFNQNCVCMTYKQA